MKDINQILFFDLDGTLLNDQHQVEPEIVRAIKDMRTRGILSIIATGRSVSAISNVLTDCEINSIVAMNGQYVELEGKEIYSDSISKDLLEEFIAFLQPLGVECSLYNAYDVWATGINDDLRYGYEQTHLEVPEVLPEAYKSRDVHMILALTPDANLDDILREKFPQFEFYRNVPFALDVVLNGISKKSGISEILKQFNNDSIVTYGLGDGPNDIELMNAVDHGICMGNGIDATKKAAEFVTTANTNRGILNALEHYKLI